MLGTQKDYGVTSSRYRRNSQRPKEKKNVEMSEHAFDIPLKLSHHTGTQWNANQPSH